MLRQFLLGGGISICNIAIHALVMTTIIRIARAVGAKTTVYPSLLLIFVLASTVAVLMMAHTVEVVVWAVAYSNVDVVPPGKGLVYFAFVNYTTLGYGDIVPEERWQLLGPMTAMNGVLLFGWSTAVIFEVLRRAMTICFPVLSMGQDPDAR